MLSVKIKLDEQKINEGMTSLAEAKKREISIPGFRKGKAPIQMIKNYLGEQLRAESLQNLIERELMSRVEKYEPFIYGPPQLQKVDEVDESEGDIEFEALLDVPPEIDIDFDSIDVEKSSDESINLDSELMRMQEINSELHSVDRAIRKGDSAFIDIESEEESISNYSHNVSTDKFSKKLTGMKKGEEKEIEMKFPEDFPLENLSGKEGKASIRINEVKEKIVPELNDEFAKDLGFDTLEELKNNLQESMEEEKKESEEEQLKDEVLEKIMETLPDLEPSPSLTEIQKNAGLTDKEAEEEAKKIMILDAVSVNQGFEIEDRELDEWMEKISENDDETIENMGEDAIHYIKLSILRNRALDYIVKKATEEDNNEEST